MLDEDYAAWTIFCDDIRQEVNGKFTFVGVYATGGITVYGSTLPIVLAKFSMFFNYWERIGRGPKSLALRISYPWAEKPELEIPIAIDEMRKSVEKSPSKETEYIAVAMPIQVTNLQIASEGIIRVELIVDDKPRLAGRLKITHSKQPVTAVAQLPPVLQ